jgi:Gas vesicle synthesis protein GvpO
VTREEKAALRAEEREKRRNPKDEVEARNGDAPRQQEEEEPQRQERPRAKRAPLKGAEGDELADMATKARELLRSLRGVEAESVSGIVRTQNGWSVMLEVVEMRRIPESTDVLASYEVELDGDGKFLGFERGSRYHRSQAGGDGW